MPPKFAGSSGGQNWLGSGQGGNIIEGRSAHALVGAAQESSNSRTRASALQHHKVKHRFTIDGSDALEARLGQTCERVLGGVQALVPAHKLEGLVLGGGYGRGEGGVLRTEAGDEPYNDLEFYVFMRGHRLLNDWKYQSPLAQFAQLLSPEAGLHVEFKIDSLERLQRSPISMFSYDLVAGHCVLAGGDELFQSCQNHLDAQKIPLAEATRLLFNRCTGLLLAKEFLRRTQLTIEQKDFIARNIAKAQLALGDAVLVVGGAYHWSCRERQKRLEQLDGSSLPALPWRQQVRRFHATGVEFKLHPQRLLKATGQLEEDYRETSTLALAVWLWLEARRLNCRFSSSDQYALSPVEKCPQTSRWRNYLLNLKTFGWKAALDSRCWRYPRERLFNALVLLLWNSEGPHRPELAQCVQNQLRTDRSDWSSLVQAYKQSCPAYG